MIDSQELETSFTVNKEPTGYDLIEVKTSYAECEKAIDFSKRKREERYLSLSEASLNRQHAVHSRQLRWNSRVIFLIILIIVILVVIMFNIYIYLFFPYQ